MDLNFVTISLDGSYVKNQILGPSRVVGTPLGLFSFFFLLFFSSYFFFNSVREENLEDLRVAFHH